MIAYNWRRFAKRKRAKEKALRLKQEKEKSSKSYRKSLLGGGALSAHSAASSRQNDPSVALSSNTSKEVKVKKPLSKQTTAVSNRPDRRNFT